MNEALKKLIIVARNAGGFSSQVTTFIEYAVSLARDGLTIAEAGQLLLGFLYLAVEAVDQFKFMPGGVKKALVLAALDKLFDAVAPYIPLPIVLSPFRGWIVPKLKVAVLLVADGAIEVIVARMRA